MLTKMDVNVYDEVYSTRCAARRVPTSERVLVSGCSIMLSNTGRLSRTDYFGLKPGGKRLTQLRLSSFHANQLPDYLPCNLDAEPGRSDRTGSTVRHTVMLAWNALRRFGYNHSKYIVSLRENNRSTTRSINTRRAAGA